jgi:hypothetical protein
MQNSFVIHNIISVFFFGGGGGRRENNFCNLLRGRKKRKVGKVQRGVFFSEKMGPSHNIMRGKKIKALFCPTLHFHP